MFQISVMYLKKTAHLHYNRVYNSYKHTYNVIGITDGVLILRQTVGITDCNK